MSVANFTRIKYDINGNPRYVTSWLGFGFRSYNQAVKAANTLGGRKYSNKQFGGGIVFQAYESELENINHRMMELASAE